MHAGYLGLQIHTLRLCNAHYFTTATMVDEGASMLSYTYIAYFVHYDIRSLFHDAVSTSSSRVIGE